MRKNKMAKRPTAELTAMIARCFVGILILSALLFAGCVPASDEDEGSASISASTLLDGGVGIRYIEDEEYDEEDEDDEDESTYDLVDSKGKVLAGGALEIFPLEIDANGRTKSFLIVKSANMYKVLRDGSTAVEYKFTSSGEEDGSAYESTLGPNRIARHQQFSQGLMDETGKWLYKESAFRTLED